jgi:hypothetical protein
LLGPPLWPVADICPACGRVGLRQEAGTITTLIRFPAVIGRLIPLLGAPVDAEALGAARAFERSLGDTGLDLRILANVVEREAITYRPDDECRRDSPSSAEAGMWCLGGGCGQLSERELEFCSGMPCLRRPTERQLDWLAAIVSKLGGER